MLKSKTDGFTVRSSSGSLDPARTDDVALFLHTSGTTSRPKGVPLTQGNLAASLSNIAKTYELVPKDRSYLVMPLFHVHGLMAGTSRCPFFLFLPSFKFPPISKISPSSDQRAPINSGA